MTCGIQYIKDGADENVMDRRETKWFVAGAAIVAKDFVMLDLTQTDADKAQYVIQATAVANGNAMVCGVALTAAAAGALVEVVIRGYVEDASVLTAVTAGLGLVVDTTAGAGSIYATGDISQIVAVALTTSTANVADVMVCRNIV